MESLDKMSLYLINNGLSGVGYGKKVFRAECISGF